MIPRLRFTLRAHLMLVLLPVAVVAGGMAGCRQSDHPVGNIQPVVRLTSGPVEGSEEFYSVPFSWTGSDADGSVAYFLYAIDDTVAVPGDSTSGWHQTVEHTKTLVFSATTRRDSSSVEFTGFHTFLLKAVDNEGTGSKVALLSFDAKTIAPTTKFTQPSKVAAGQGYNSPLLGGPSIRLEWDGEDPDGVRTRKPVQYILTRVKTGDNLAGQFDRADAALRGPDAQRILLDGAINFDVFNDLAEVGTRSNWIFGIQGVDEAGATEPTFRGSISSDSPNMFFFQAAGNLQGPAMIVTSVALGAFTAQGISRDSAQYVFDRPIDISWSADASEYGATVVAYRWGVDVLDVTDDRDPGWATGWSANLTMITGLRFTDQNSVIHDIVVQAQDSNGSITTAIIRLTLVLFPLDRDVLFVDDEWENPTSGFTPSDPEHKSFMLGVIRDALASLGRPVTVDTLNTFPGLAYTDFKIPLLTDLAHYRIVVWDIGAQSTYATYFKIAAVSPSIGPTHANILAAYLESGGDLVLSGSKPVAMSATPDGLGPWPSTPIGPEAGLAPGKSNFPFDYWGIPNRIYFGISDRSHTHGLRSMEPTEYALSHGYLGGYPRLELDETRWPSLIASGGPIGLEGFDAQPRVTEGGDAAQILYTFNANGGSRSYMNGKYDMLLFKKKPTDPSVEDWKYQVVYAPAQWYFFRTDEVSATLTNLFYEFLNDRKWGTDRVTATPRGTTALPLAGR